MKVHLRPPFDHEWSVCRMLLPEVRTGDPAREFLLCVREETPRFAAAASFHQNSEAVTDLRIHVIPPFRRCGIGRQIVAWLARERTRTVSGSVEVNREPDAAIFCQALGFQPAETLTTVETELAEMREYMRTLRARRDSESAIQLVPLSQVSPDQVAELQARCVANQADSGLWRALLTGTTDPQGSVVALVDGSVAGALVGVIEGDTAVVRSKFAVPGPRRASINLLLMAEALEGAWARGAKRVRFTYDSSNRDTQKLARRFHAQITGVVTLFTLPASCNIVPQKDV